ncbi:MAG: LPXTG cell wall anchor domain-containing protein [Lachnospiraceae bacterium]|nr:LPXTG cell wall anchor domain-containing protein [Lachnospiraceae bacterium]MDY5742618.1 LPXTG cell wall anchor domain-containing protein [Lachnospiraceae bacterium]
MTGIVAASVWPTVIAGVAVVILLAGAIWFSRKKKGCGCGKGGCGSCKGCH